jgi:glucose-1-phosphate thymidylyltransferase
MKAIIPMAGSGTRLRPLTHSRPKALLRVGSKPILAHIIDSLIVIGCDEFILIISHEGAKIPQYLRENYPGIKIETIIQEETLGLGHAVNLAEKKARGSEIVVIYGDTIIKGELTDLVDNTVDGVIAVKEVDDPRRFGVVNVKDGIITKFVEKPTVPESNLAIVGLNYFKQSDNLFDCLHTVIDKNLKTKGEFQITDAFQMMVESGYKMKPFRIEGWFDAGTQKSLLETNSYMLKKDGNTACIEGSVIIPPVFIPENAVIVNSIIGPDVCIGDNAIIEKSIISDSIIGAGAKIKKAVLSGSLIGEYAEVADIARKLSISDHSSLDFSPDPEKNGK